VYLFLDLVAAADLLLSWKVGFITFHLAAISQIV